LYLLIQGIVLTTFVFQISMEPVSGQWRMHLIDESLNHTVDIKAHDIDADGDMDLFVAEEKADKLLMYECITENGLQWKKHVIDDRANGCLGLGLADFDADGETDLVATHFSGDQLVWYKRANEGNPDQWVMHIIDDSHDGPSLVWAEDINGDGAIDVVVKYNNSGGIAWYENTLPSEWIRHPINPTYTGRGDIFVADFNNDNRLDVVGAQAYEDKVTLYLNDLPGNGWKEVSIDADRERAKGCPFGDIDNDGDMDLASTGRNPNLLWYENQDSGRIWIKHPVDEGISGMDWVIIRDLDNDGYVDLIPTDEGGEGLFWLRNVDGGKNWTKHIVDSKYQQPLAGFGYDIDLDQDIDLVPSRWAVGSLVWYENPIPSAFALSLTASPYLVDSPDDTLRINASLYNPEKHPAMAWAVITGEQTAFSDTIQLFDDGSHDDGDPIDNLWGVNRLVSDLPEDEFLTAVFTYDSSLGDTLGYGSFARFINLGPVEYDWYLTYPVYPNDDSIANRGEAIYLKVAVKNSSAMARATNIEVELSSLDTLVIPDNTILGFSDIPAGYSALSNIKCRVLIDKECPVEQEIPMGVNIYSHGHLCWQDTIPFLVFPTGKNEEYKEAQIRIYPNPAGDHIIIDTEYPGPLWIRINSLNGQLLLSDKRSGPTQQVDLSAFSQGVYFITIRSDRWVSTRKFIKQH
jgi:hypothetical protein